MQLGLSAVYGGCFMRILVFVQSVTAVDCVQFCLIVQNSMNAAETCDGLLCSASRRLAKILPRHTVRADGPGSVLVLCEYLRRLKGHR